MLRAGQPFGIGHGDGEMYLGSDAFALAPFTNRVCYWPMAIGRLCAATGQKFIRLALARWLNVRLKRSMPPPPWLIKAIIGTSWRRKFTNSPTLSRTFGQYIDPEANGVLLPQNDLDFSKINRVILVACGTAYFAAQVGRNWIERYARIPASIDIASEFRYRDAPMDEDCLAVFVSQSGETADTWPHCTTAKHMVCKQSVWSMCRKVPSPAKLT